MGLAEPTRQRTNKMLEMMEAPSVRKVQPKPLKWRESHHWLAMSVARAQALKQPIFPVAAGCGYSRQQLKRLMGEFQFKELVKHYEKLLSPNDVRPPLTERDLMSSNFIKGLRLQADWMEEISDQCERGGPYPAGLIHDHLEFLADRLGYGPEQVNVNVGVTGYAEGLARARKEEILKLGPRRTGARTEEIQARAEGETGESIKPLAEAPIGSPPMNGGGHAD